MVSPDTPAARRQELAAARFTAFQREYLAFLFGPAHGMAHAEKLHRIKEIETRHEIRNGWTIVDGEGFDMEKAFPDRHNPRWSGDQGVSD